MKPFLLADPEDVTSREGDDVALECEVGGDPAPSFTWTKESGEVLAGAKESRLELRRVRSQDEGVYSCKAENAVGSVMGSVSLIVHAEPVFLVKPNAARVGLNGIAKFDCVARGNPPPSVFWTKEVTISCLSILRAHVFSNAPANKEVLWTEY